MSEQFQQTAKNLLRVIDCPCFAEENIRAVEQFLHLFALHILAEEHHYDLYAEGERKHIEQIAQEIDDMPEEQNA